MCKTGPILESKGMYAIFSKKGKKGQQNVNKRPKRANHLKIWATVYKIRKYFEKGHVIVCSYRTQ